jgi:hypothetical protein
MATRFSRGALIASYSGLCRPEIFGNVISLSGSYWWSPGEAGGKGCHVVYVEFPGSHAPFNWVQAFPEAIIATLGFRNRSLVASPNWQAGISRP